MGKGDQKTKRGKIHIGSTGVTRPKKKAAAKKTAANKAKVEICDVQTETVNGLTRKDFPSIQNYQDWIADRVDPFLSVSILHV